jgi:flagellar L-ring protein precursor FlgH
MKGKAKWLITESFVALAVLCVAMTAGADSLWNDQSSSACNSISNFKPLNFKIGDLLTISVVETAQASQTAASSNDKSGTVTSGPGSGLLQRIFPSMGGTFSSQSKGDGSTTRSGTLTATITVEIKSIQPNGLLVFEGRQVIKVNGEDQVLVVSGTARPEDVGPDNVLLSTYIANSSIEYKGKGTVGDPQKQGILTKFFQWLF